MKRSFVGWVVFLCLSWATLGQVPVEPQDSEVWAASDGVLYRAWRSFEPRPTNIQFARSLDNGVTWEASQRLSPINIFGPPQMAAVNENVVVAWLQCDSGGGTGYCWPLHIAVSDDWGEHFQRREIAERSDYSGPLQLATDGQTIAIGWNVCHPNSFCSFSPVSDVILFVSRDGGQSFARVVVAEGWAGLYWPTRLLVSGQDAYVWIEYRAPVPEKRVTVLQHVPIP